MSLNRILSDAEISRGGSPGSDVSAAPAPDLRALALLAGEDAEAVVFDFVQPAGFGGRPIGERWLAQSDEADWRIASPTGRGRALLNRSPGATRRHHDRALARASTRGPWMG